MIKWKYLPKRKDSTKINPKRRKGGGTAPSPFLRERPRVERKTKKTPEIRLIVTGN